MKIETELTKLMAPASLGGRKFEIELIKGQAKLEGKIDLVRTRLEKQISAGQDAIKMEIEKLVKEQAKLESKIDKLLEKKD